MSHSKSPAQNAEEQPTLHVVDRAVRDIAQEFRFTVEEVQEYYDKCGDVERTRTRFRRMRETLSALQDEDIQQGS